MTTSPKSTELPHVLVGIPTFRRPEGLGKLLDSLREDFASSKIAQAGRVRVLIVDNDCDPRTEEVVRAHDPGVPCTVEPVTEPGYSEIRNVLIAGALADPEIDWLLWVDDDAKVCSPWLDSMIEAAQKYDADLVGGPVLGDVPQEASALIRNSLYAGLPRYETGPITFLNGNCNRGLSRRYMERLPEQAFDRALGKSGGEDYEFFRRARVVGARVVWCDDAAVVEPLVDARLSNKALLARIRNSNRTGARIDVAYDGLAGAVRTTAKQSWWTVKAVGAGVVRRDPNRFFEAANKAAGVAGRVQGIVRHLAGNRYERLPLPTIK